jgi:uncharacterized protein (DUF58 family)
MRTPSAAEKRTIRDRLFRLKGPQVGLVRTHHSRIYLLPTGAGWMFGFTLLTMMLASINYALSLGLVLTFSLGGVGLAGAMRGFRNLLGIEIQAGKCAPVFCGTPAAFTLLLVNPKSRDRVSLELRSEDDVAQMAILPGDRTQAIDVHVATHTRGWLLLPWLSLETRYPLGLVKVWAFVRPLARTLVYPKPEAHPPPLPMALGSDGQHTEAGLGTEDFASLRDHQPTDSPRHIAWKIAARDGPLVTKQFSGVSGGKLRLEWNALPNSLTTEQKISRLTAWVCQAHESSVRWHLLTPEADLGPDRGESHYAACLAALALHGNTER